MTKKLKKKIWIDLDNSPHVPFFRPIMKELKAAGYPVALTIRNCSQTVKLADLYDFQYKKIGKHYGKNKLLKIGGTLFRSLQMLPHIVKERPAIAVSHGSRSMIILANLLRIPVLAISDYEHSSGWVKLDWLLVPEIIPKSSYHPLKPKQIHTYPGIKEDVYVPCFTPDAAILDDLKIPKGNIFVTIRPPAVAAHYHNPESEKLFEEIISYFSEQKNLTMLILPRYKSQAEEIKAQYAGLVKSGTMIVPEKVYDGLNLIWFSDFVVSGGGTMNREAAALGVPVYSIFRGKIGAVDNYLSKSGRLVLLESVADVRKKIRIEKRKIPKELCSTCNETLNSVVGTIVRLLETSKNTR